MVYPSTGKAQDEEFYDYLQGEAVEVVSSLLATIKLLDGNRPDYTLKLVRGHPELSHFFQYLAHALKVGGFESASAEVEEILRSSLIFHNLSSSERGLAERLVQWSRGFMAEYRSNSLLGVADATGLSLPSVGKLAVESPRVFRDPDFWDPGNLFGDDLGPLTTVVETLSQIPEMSLAPSDEVGGINARRVAGVMRDWVAGKSLSEISDHWFPGDDNSLSRAGRYLFRDLAGQMPWGIGALQLIELATATGDSAERARQVPAMAFYGVSDARALPMRMVGIPRTVASQFGQMAPEFSSFQDARNWLTAQPDSVWSRLSQESGLRAETLRCIWDSVGGSAA